MDLRFNCERCPTPEAPQVGSASSGLGESDSPSSDKGLLNLEAMVLLGPGFCNDHSAQEEIEHSPSAMLSKASVKGTEKGITLLQQIHGRASELNLDSCKAKCMETPE